MIFPDDSNSTMYTLDIINAILKNSVCEDDPNHLDVLLYRDDWIERFLKLGGFNQLEGLLEKAIEGNNKKFLDVMLRMMKVFCMALIKAEYDEAEAEQMLMLKKTSSSIKQNEEK